ncbi:hypothetical protein Tco_0548359 [Tanacetum coccineum]
MCCQPLPPSLSPPSAKLMIMALEEYRLVCAGVHDHLNNDRALSGDDDYICRSTDGLPGLVSWLGSHSKHVITAMSIQRYSTSKSLLLMLPPAIKMTAVTIVVSHTRLGRLKVPVEIIIFAAIMPTIAVLGVELAMANAHHTNVSGAHFGLMVAASPCALAVALLVYATAISV